MAPEKKATSTKWSADFDTARREKLFRQPPKDHTPFPTLAKAIKPHIDSFDAVFEENGLLAQAIKDIGVKSFLDGNPATRDAKNSNQIHVRITQCILEKPSLPPTNKFARVREIYPSECRERHSTYRGRFQVRLQYKLNNGPWQETIRKMGYLPIMLKSQRCHLRDLSPAQLVNRKEDAEEFGGYFIVNGNEKFVRMLIQPKRNYPMAISRSTFVNRGPSYSNMGIQVRSVRADQTSQTNTIHYLKDGNIIFRFSWRKAEYNVPVMMILKALTDTNDLEIFEGIVGPAGSKATTEKQFVIDRVEQMLRTYKRKDRQNKSKTRAYLGSRFRPVLNVPDSLTDEEVGTVLLRKIVLPHLGSHDVTDAQDADKSRMLLFMIRKLYALVEGECAPDNQDALSMHELLLSGFLYGMFLKERLEEWVNSIGLGLREWGRNHNWRAFDTPNFMEKDFESLILNKTNEKMGEFLEFFLSTGNLSSPTGLDLQQTSGFSVTAEKINIYRFISHFRSVHRGSFFADNRTTSVRKLLPESWGFMCPVHTPDGTPCGLLNHLAHKCEIATKSLDVSNIPGLLAGFGLTPYSQASMKHSVVVQLNGRILGFCTPKQAKAISDTLRYWKVEGSNKIPLQLEIGYVPNSNGGQYPGIYMFAHPARMTRPVKYLPLDKQDYIGPFEQPFMSIACYEHEIISGDSTHVEYTPTNMLSILGNLTPFSDFNQSPRNMYQCQMSKQTMGTFANNLNYRADNKVYRLQTGQTPVVRPPVHHEYGMDNYPNGTNAIVAVISYTGYDMDDAMIVSKSSHERGFAHGTIYKTKKYALDEAGNRNKARAMKSVTKLFGFAPGGYIPAAARETLDDDGLPRVGQMVKEGTIVAAYHSATWDPTTGTLVNKDGQTQFYRYKDSEVAYIDQVRLLGSEEGTAPVHSITIKFRIPRFTAIGDKFSSRHGQKGVCSQKWKTEDLPFSESGLVPDVIINPHAFPSRMTIGMFIESLAGKSGALHGFAQDCTPFQFEDDPGNTAVDYFGEQLRAAGYNFYGNEPMYSGITGEELAADIYIGVVYYQRLRHMVNDKYQVRTTGPVAQNTGQPVKGRSRGGGIRVGEMERDSLIAHGTAFLLQDRLMNCSDYTKSWMCRQCGTFLATTPTVGGFEKNRRGNVSSVRCRRCAKRAETWTPKLEIWEDGDGVRMTGGDETTVVAVPGVLKYLDAELASMGISMRYDVKP